MPTTIVSASADLEAAEKVQELLMNEKFRIYANSDVIGVELGGALKKCHRIGGWGMRWLRCRGTTLRRP